MIKRGRKSKASMDTPVAAVITTNKRLEAPAHLTEAERAIWIEVVNDQPATAFSPTHSPMIEMYCRHIVNNRILGDEILKFDRSQLRYEEGLKQFDRLLKIAERESRAASSIATRLRITRQAIDQQTVARALL